MSQRRHETPPPDHPLPTVFTPGGWQWDPDAGDYVPAQALPAPALLNPAPEPTEVTDATI